MIKKQSGFTLVELLGGLALLGFLIILIGSAHLYGQRQYSQQSAAINKQVETRKVINQLTKDLRSVTSEEVYFQDDQLMVGINIYHHEGKLLHRNERVLSEGIEIFSVDLTEDGLEIKIESTENKNRQRSSIETAIYFRK